MSLDRLVQFDDLAESELNDFIPEGNQSEIVSFSQKKNFFFDVLWKACRRA